MRSPVSGSAGQRVSGSATTCAALDQSDIAKFTDAVLDFWRNNGTKMKAWAATAKICFAILPSSGASERVFALLKNMFGKDQLNALADYIEVALMLRYNKRKVG